MAMTTKEAAQVLGMTDSGVRRLIIEGKLPAQKLGRDWAINEGILADYKIAMVKRGGAHGQKPL